MLRALLRRSILCSLSSQFDRRSVTLLVNPSQITIDVSYRHRGLVTSNWVIRSPPVRCGILREALTTRYQCARPHHVAAIQTRSVWGPRFRIPPHSGANNSRSARAACTRPECLGTQRKGHPRLDTVFHRSQCNSLGIVVASIDANSVRIGQVPGSDPSISADCIVPCHLRDLLLANRADSSNHLGELARANWARSPPRVRGSVIVEARHRNVSSAASTGTPPAASTQVNPRNMRPTATR